MGGIWNKRDLDGTRLPPGLPCGCGSPEGGDGKAGGNDVWAAALTARPPNGLCPG